MNKSFIIILMLCLIVPLINAVAPVTTIFQGESGYRVITQAPRFLEAGGSGATTVHIFNISNGVIISNFTDERAVCEAIIQYPNGTDLQILWAFHTKIITIFT